MLAASPANGRLEPDELLAELRRKLPRYMVPKHVVVRGSLPRSPNNKFDRNLLRQELAGKLTADVATAASPARVPEVGGIAARPPRRARRLDAILRLRPRPPHRDGSRC